MDLVQWSGKAVETATVWTDANQRVLRELVDFSAARAREGVKLYAELQQKALEALRVDSVEKALTILEGQAQMLVRSAERMQTSAEQTGKSIQETCTAGVAKIRASGAQAWGLLRRFLPLLPEPLLEGTKALSERRYFLAEPLGVRIGAVPLRLRARRAHPPPRPRSPVLEDALDLPL